MAPRTWCPARVSGLFCPPALPTLPSPLPCVTTNPSSLCLPTPSLWMVARSVWTTQANPPGEPEGVPLGHMGVAAATLEVNTVVNLVTGYEGEPPVSSLCGQLKCFLSAVGGGDQGYGSGRYDNRPGGYGYGYGRSRDYGGRWVSKVLGSPGSPAFLLKSWTAWVFINILLTMVLLLFAFTSLNKTKSRKQCFELCVVH